MFKRSSLEKQVDKIPKEVIWCKKCTMSNQRPRIIFNSAGICSGCINTTKKKKINWEEREKELIELLNKHRSKNGNYDVIIPSSGGKDSNYVAHILKNKYKMNPLTVTWSPLSYTAIGRTNHDAMIGSGFNNILFTPNGITQRALARLCLEELGDAFHVFVMGQFAYPFHIALQMGIKLVFYGENGELEYAGDPVLKDKPFKPFELFKDHHFKGVTLDELISYGLENKQYIKDNIKNISNSDLNFYKLPKIENLLEKGIVGKHFFSYYCEWIPQENYYYASQNTGFRANSVRSEGTYSKYASLDDKMDGFHYYLRYIKFGLGRCSEDTAHEIRDGHITREEGINLMKKFEGEFPSKYLNEFLNYLNITEKEFEEIVDEWRPQHLWNKTNKGWDLKNPIK
jgi:N-acetyl sugar amidotransferase